MVYNFQRPLVCIDMNVATQDDLNEIAYLNGVTIAEIGDGDLSSEEEEQEEDQIEYSANSDEVNQFGNDEEPNEKKFRCRRFKQWESMHKRVQLRRRPIKESMDLSYVQLRKMQILAKKLHPKRERHTTKALSREYI